jgi:hypothetical protein
VDEAGFYLLPGVVRTYSPAGLTPVLYEWQTRDHLSAMSGVTPEGELFELVRGEPLTGAESAGFLGRLLRHARRWLVVWDRSPIHRGERCGGPWPGARGGRSTWSCCRRTRRT